MRSIALAAALAAGSTALAQEMAGMPSATAPSPGVVIPRVQLHGFWFEDDQFLLEESLRVEIGVARDLSVSAELPLFQGFLNAPRPQDGEFGFGDMDLLVELRILREDLNAIDTLRASVFAGAEIPTGSDAYSQGSVDPCVGDSRAHQGQPNPFHAVASKQDARGPRPEEQALEGCVAQDDGRGVLLAAEGGDQHQGQTAE